MRGLLLGKTVEAPALRDLLGEVAGRALSDDRTEVALSDAATGTILGGRRGELAGRNVLLSVTTQLLAGLALIELDGVAARILLRPPDLADEHIPALTREAALDAVVTDTPERWAESGLAVFPAGLSVRPAAPARTERATEWLMLTSGTTGTPKIVGHSLEALTAAIRIDGPPKGAAPVWATFYDIRRYGGLQIFLRAVTAGGSLVLSAPGEVVADHLARLTRRGVTHVSGTPSHWRKAMMSGAATSFRPAYVRLSGEIADQAVLDALRGAFPESSIGHAYASTEAGVGFAVNDGREGFPAAFVDAPQGGVELKVADGSLRIRSARGAHGYVGTAAAALADAQGFIDTGDMVERRGERWHFVGRRGGIINVGGLKVHPEEVESVINRHGDVRMSRVRSRKSPITGAIVVADVQLADGADPDRKGAIRDEILGACRAALPGHKIPAMISFVPAIAVLPSGKLARADA